MERLLVRWWRWWRWHYWGLRWGIRGNGRIKGVVGVVGIVEMAIVVVSVLSLVGLWRITGHTIESPKRVAAAALMSHKTSTAIPRKRPLT